MSPDFKDRTFFQLLPLHGVLFRKFLWCTVSQHALVGRPSELCKYITALKIPYFKSSVKLRFRGRMGNLAVFPLTEKWDDPVREVLELWKGLSIRKWTKPNLLLINLLLQVRCLVDHGEFETQDGANILLKKNSQVSMWYIVIVWNTL